MASLGDLVARLGLEGLTEFKAAMASVPQAMQDAADKAVDAWAPMQTLGASLMGIGAGLSAAITAPLVGIGAAAISMGEQFNRAEISFTTMLGSGQKAKAFLEELKQFAASTPFEFPELLESAKRMKALGFESQQVIPMLRTIGDATSALSGGKDVLNGITKALGDMQTKGKVSAEEMNQLAERGINAWKYLANAIGKDIPTAMKLAQDGTLKAADAIPAILAGMQKDFGGQMQKMSGTLTGTWSNFKDTLSLTLGQIGQTLTPVVTQLVQAAMPLLEWAKQAAVWFAGLSEPVRNTALAFAALMAAIGPLLLIAGTLASSIASVGVAMQTLSPLIGAVSAGMTGFAVRAVPAAIAAVATFATSTLPAAISAVGLFSTALIAQAESSVVRFATTTIPTAITALGTFATSAIPAAISALTTFATTTIPAAISSLTTFGASTIPSATAALVTFARAGLANAVTSLGAMTTQAIPALLGALATLGVAASVAGAAFAGWKIGQVLYDSIEPARKLGDAMANLIMKIPGVTYAIEKLSGASNAQARAAADQAFADQKLAEAKARLAAGSNVASGESLKLAAAIALSAKEAKDAEKAANKLAKEQKSAEAEARKLERAADDQAAAHIRNDQATGRFLAKLDEWQEKHRPAIEATKELTQAIQAMELETSAAGLAVAGLASNVNTQLAAALQAPINPITNLEAAFEKLGITSVATLQKQAEAARIAYEDIASNSNAKLHDVDAAWVKYEEARIAAARAMGEAIPRETEETLKKVKEKLEGKDAKTPWFDWSKQVSTIITDLGKNISEALWDGDKSWAEKGKSILKSLGEAFTRAFIEPATKAIADFISGAISELLGQKGLGGVDMSIKNIGKSMSDVFGRGGTATGSLPAGFPQGGATVPVGASSGGASNAGGGILSGLGGLVGAINMASGIAGAVGSIGTFVNSFRQEGTLNGIEKEARESKIHLASILDKTNEFLPELANIRGYLWTTLQPTLTSMLSKAESLASNSKASAPTFYVNITVTGSDNPRATADEVMRQLRAQGVTA